MHSRSRAPADRDGPDLDRLAAAQRAEAAEAEVARLRAELARRRGEREG